MDVAGVLWPSSGSCSSRFVAGPTALGLAAAMGVMQGGKAVAPLGLMFVMLAAALCPAFVFAGGCLFVGVLRN